jgi:error-prone DNA polymerase
MKHSKALQEAATGAPLACRHRSHSAAPWNGLGVVLVTLEDEFDITNLVVWPSVFETYRKVVMCARMLAAKGRVQREDLVIFIL